MSDKSLYTASNAINNGIEVVKAVNTGKYDKVVANGKTQLDHYLTGTAMNAGVNTYAIGYAKNILNGMSTAQGSLGQKFMQATGLADILGSGQSSAGVIGAPLSYAEAAFNPQNYFDSNSKSLTNGSQIGSVAYSSSSFVSPDPDRIESHVKGMERSMRTDVGDVTQPDYSRLNSNNDNTPVYSINANDSTGYRSLRTFLEHIDNFGVQVQNNFEVTFYGIDGLTLFVTNIELPGSKQNTCEIFYDGIKMTIPVNYEHDHEFSMTILNDANGFIYSVIKSFIELDSYNHFTDTGNIMKVQAMTGQVYTDEGQPYQGSMIKCYGVRLNSMSGLSYGQNNNDVQTFTVNGTMNEYSHMPLYISRYAKDSSNSIE